MSTGEEEEEEEEEPGALVDQEEEAVCFSDCHQRGFPRMNMRGRRQTNGRGAEAFLVLSFESSFCRISVPPGDERRRGRSRNGRLL